MFGFKIIGIVVIIVLVGLGAQWVVDNFVFKKRGRK